MPFGLLAHLGIATPLMKKIDPRDLQATYLATKPWFADAAIKITCMDPQNWHPFDERSKTRVTKREAAVTVFERAHGFINQKSTLYKVYGRRGILTASS